MELSRDISNHIKPKSALCRVAEGVGYITYRRVPCPERGEMDLLMVAYGINDYIRIGSVDVFLYRA